MLFFTSRYTWCLPVFFVAMLQGLPEVEARGSAVLVDQGLSARGLRFVATASWRPGAVAVATEREVLWRTGRRRWRRLTGLVSGTDDAANQTAARIRALAWARSGLVIGLQRGLLMLGTGGFTFYEAIRRFFVPFEPEVDWFTFTAVILSALACGLLYLYQRFVGLRSGQLALITQSVDSRNHVIVAASVTAGLVASLLRFGLLDTLVGLAVAILILKSAIELAIETIRTFGEEEIDLSRHRMGLVERYERLRQAQLRDWMLYVVENGGVSARAELISQARDALDFQDNPALRELGLAQQPQTAELIARSLEELLERGWLVGDEALSVTGSGRAHLKQQMAGTRGDRHRLSPGQR